MSDAIKRPVIDVCTLPPRSTSQLLDVSHATAGKDDHRAVGSDDGDTLNYLNDYDKDDANNDNSNSSSSSCSWSSQKLW